jgi:hypothetical protein
MPKTALGIVRKYYPQVTRLVEAKKSASFIVTREDSKRSNRKSPNHCALATACERQFDGAIISMTRAYLIKGKKAIRYVVPQAVAREIVSFDRHKDFAHGQYKLNAPTDCNKLQPRGNRPLRPIRSGYSGTKQRHKTSGIRSL